MIIQSKFHDYYDTILRQVGIDKIVVFHRVTEAIEESFDLPTYNVINIGSSETSLNYVIFCGKLVPFIYNLTGYSCYESSKTERLYDHDEIKAFIGHVKFGMVLDAINKDYTEICIEHKSPIISIENFRYNRDKHITKNIQLSKVNFQKYATPFECYSKIYGFLSGVLTNPEKEARPISDKLKVTNHGFDKTISFRKESHQRKSK